MAIASYAPPETAARIPQTLGAIRTVEALAALRCLRHLAHESLTPAVDYQARKLQLAGVHIEATATWRALWSPMNAQGQSLLWLIRRQAEADQADLLVLVLHDNLGIAHVAASPDTPTSGLPMPAPLRHIHRLRLPGSHQIIHLAEIEAITGLYLANQGVRVMRSLNVPWPMELVVFGRWLWAEEKTSVVDPPWPPLPEPALRRSRRRFCGFAQASGLYVMGVGHPRYRLLVDRTRREEPLSEGGDSCTVR